MTYIIKASGDKERFSKQKLMQSAQNAGASRALAQAIATRVAKEVHEGTTTKEMYQKTARLLKSDFPSSCRYQLRASVMKLGPSGFPFEQFFARILEEQGFKTKVGTILKGKATTHEVDIVARGPKTFMIECKFHNKPGVRTDTKVAMYTHARFLDLKDNKRNGFSTDWLVTNTKCTSHALEYAKGVGLAVTTWSYASSGKPLQKLLEERALYPVTLFTNVKGPVKDHLFKEGYVFAKDLLNADLSKVSRETGIKKNILQKIVKEADRVCTS